MKNIRSWDFPFIGKGILLVLAITEAIVYLSLSI